MSGYVITRVFRANILRRETIKVVRWSEFGNSGWQAEYEPLDLAASENFARVTIFETRTAAMAKAKILAKNDRGGKVVSLDKLKRDLILKALT